MRWTERLHVADGFSTRLSRFVYLDRIVAVDGAAVTRIERHFLRAADGDPRADVAPAVSALEGRRVVLSRDAGPRTGEMVEVVLELTQETRRPSVPFPSVTETSGR